MNVIKDKVYVAFYIDDRLENGGYFLGAHDYMYQAKLKCITDLLKNRKNKFSGYYIKRINFVFQKV